jgi:hypothetical protein
MSASGGAAVLADMPITDSVSPPRPRGVATAP